MAIRRQDLPASIRNQIKPPREPQMAKADLRPSKYGSRTTHSYMFNRTFHSLAEKRYAEEVLAIRQKAGEITGLEFQKHVTLLNAVPMVVDFYYHEDGRPVYHELKGKPMAVWVNQRRLWEQVGPGEYRVTKAAFGDPWGWHTTIINPRPNEDTTALMIRLLEQAGYAVQEIPNG